MGRCEDKTLVWDIRWKRSFFIHEKPIVDDYLSVTPGHNFSLDIYKWLWKFAKDDSFSVSSTYHSLVASFNSSFIGYLSLSSL